MTLLTDGEQVRARLAAATPGPWRLSRYDPLEVWADRGAGPGWDSKQIDRWAETGVAA